MPTFPASPERPRISVALCTYNGERFVADQLRSVLGQTSPADQIVIADDGSTDGTLAEIRETLARAGDSVPTITILERARLGVTANFERAAAACTGDLIALCDQDDVWHPEKLTELAAVFTSQPDLLLVHSDARMVDAEGRPLGRTLFETLGMDARELERVHAGRAFEALLRRNIVTGATAMLRRGLVAHAAPFPASWVHDEWLAVVAATTGRVEVMERELIDYRQHGGNQIGASQLTGSRRIGRLRAPRSARNARLLVRAADLADRLRSLDPAPAPEVIERADEKLRHEEARSALPAPRLARLAPVIREWRTGRYDDYGLGAQDVLRDLVQPVD